MLRVTPAARALLLAAADIARLRDAATCGRIDAGIAALVARHPDHRPGGRPSTVGAPAAAAVVLDAPLQQLIDTVDAEHELTEHELIDDARRDPCAATVLAGHPAGTGPDMPPGQ